MTKLIAQMEERHEQQMAVMLNALQGVKATNVQQGEAANAQP